MNNQIKELITKKFLSKEEAQIVGDYISSNQDYIEVVKIVSEMQNHQFNLVKVWPLINNKVVAIVTMTDELNLDEDYFEKWFIFDYGRYSSKNYYHNLKDYISAQKGKYKDWVMLNTEDASFP